MKRSLFLVLAWSLLAFGWENALKPAGPGRRVSFAEGGRSLCVLALDAEPSPQDRYAAEWLRKALQTMTGGDFPIVSRAEVGGRPFIGLGLRPLDPALGDEGYWIAVEEGNLYLDGGRARRSINAVAALLTEDLDCRFYSPLLGPQYPHQATLSATVVPRAYVPRLEVRTVYTCEARDAEWVVFNRAAPVTAEPPMPAEAGPYGFYPPNATWHTFATLAPDASLLSSQPELFAELDGRRVAGNPCLTNPRSAQLAAGKAMAILREHPEAHRIGVSQNDGAKVLCSCPRCAALASEESSASSPLLFFVNAVAEQIHQQFPEVEVTTLAYQESYRPPRHLRPGKKVVIFLATDHHAWKQPFRFLEESQDFRSALEEWSKAADCIHIWDYVFGDNANWLLPAPNFDVVAHNFRYLLQYPSVKGIFFQDNFLSIGSSRGAMKNWILTMLAWNPDWDLQKLERDYTLGAYGAGGPAMQRYNDLLRSEWQAWHDGPSQGQGFFQLAPAAAAQARKFLDAAATAAAGENQRVRDAIAREAASMDYWRICQGPKDAADKAAYCQDIDRFAATCRRLGISSLSEGERLEALLLRKKLEVNYRKPEPSTPHGLVLSPFEAVFPAVCGAAAASPMADPESASMVVIYQPCPFTHWSIQWQTQADFFQHRAGQWKLRLKVRCAPFRTSGPVMIFGVYAPETREYRLQTVLNSTQLSDQGYAWVEAGTASLAEEPYWFYAGPATGAVCDSLRVEALEMIPERDWASLPSAAKRAGD